MVFDPQDILKILGSLANRSWEESFPPQIPYFPLTKMVIRPGHFSVREFLVSEGIKDSKVSKFSIIDILVDLFIAESCLQ